MVKKTEALKLAQDLRALADRFSEGWHDGIKIDASDIVLLSDAAEALAEQPAQHERVQPDSECKEDDGCPTEKAVLQRFWRKAQQQEPVAWMPIEQMYPQAKAIDILMGDGSILCAVLPQFDGDLWWEGSGTGEKFIDPKYANVTHWRIHDERTSPPASKPWVGLTDEERDAILDREFKQWWSRHDAVCRAIEAKLREKNA